MNPNDALAMIGEECTPKEKESAREDHRGRKKERRIVKLALTEISEEKIKHHRQ